jgi:thiamine-phosphate pyrophosphorylase
MRLLLITDWSLGEEPLLSALAQACALGPAVGIQHRHPGAAGRLFLAEARRIADLCARHQNPFFVNGRLDVALLLGAHLHLPVNGPSPAEVRPHLPAGMWLSAAVHDEAELQRAAGADLVLVSPVYPPTSKPVDVRTPLGPAGYARLRARAHCPALALGGIRPDTLPSLGPADGVAVQGAVLGAPDPASVVRALLSLLSQPGAPSEPLPTLAPPPTRGRR